MKQRNSWRKNVYILAVCNSFTAASYTMIVPFLPLYLMELGADESDVAVYSGFVYAVTFLIAAIMAPFWGKLADARGKKIMGMRAVVMLAITYLVGGFVSSPEGLFGMRIIQGFANGFMPMAMTMGSCFSPQKEIGYGLGIIHSGMIFGSVVGPLIGGLVSHLVGMRNSFYVAGGALVFLSFLYWFLMDEPPTAEERAVRDGEPLPNPEDLQGKTVTKKTGIIEDITYAFGNKRLMAILFIIFSTNLANYTLQPVIALHVGTLLGSKEDVSLISGFVFGLGGLSGAIAAANWGKFGQRRGFFRALAYAFGGAGIFTVAQFFAPDVYVFGALQFLFGLFFMGANPASASLLAQSAPAEFQGRAFGLSSTANQLGGMVGPLLAGFVAVGVGVAPLFIFTGTALLIYGAVMWHYREKEQ